MKTHTFLAILILASFLAACGVEPEPATPDETTVEEADEPVPSQPTRPENEEYEETSSNETTTSREQLEILECDASTNTITFSIENDEAVNWNLDRRAPLVSSSEVNIGIYINDYQANRNSLQNHPETRERMFGPQTLFSDNCAGEEILAPGDSVECTLTPIPLNTRAEVFGSGEDNTIRLDSTEGDKTVEFTC